MTIRLFLDAGHSPGTINTGAVVDGVYEEQVNYTVTQLLADLLDADCRFAVRTSRMYPQQVLGTNSSTSLNERVSMANAWPADYFFSIHCNYNESSLINGSEIYVYQNGSIAWEMAQIILPALTQYAGTKDNLVRINPSLYVLRKTTMPALLIELGYLTNEKDRQKLIKDPYAFAYGIYMGILYYFTHIDPQATRCRI